MHKKMRNALIIIILALAAITLSASIIKTTSPSSDGTVTFECASMPALNCSIQLDDASKIYSLVPGNIRDICEEQYVVVSDKCSRSSRFSYEGVNVRVLKNDGKIATVEFSVPGYKITARDVAWRDLDIMFVGVHE